MEQKLVEGENIDHVNKCMDMFKQAVGEFNEVSICARTFIRRNKEQPCRLVWAQDGEYQLLFKRLKHGKRKKKYTIQSWTPGQYL